MRALRSVSRASALRFENMPSFFFGLGGGGDDDAVGTAAAGVALVVDFGGSSSVGFDGGDFGFGSTLFFIKGENSSIMRKIEQYE